MAQPGLDAELDRAVVAGEAPAYLILFAASHPGRIFRLAHNTALIGRGDGVDVPLVDPSVSARHARIINGGHGFEVEDLGSTNGTFVGGQRVARSLLRHGDRLAIGSVELMFFVDRPNNATVRLAATRQIGAPTANLSLSPQASGRFTAPIRVRPAADDGVSLTEMIRSVAAGYRRVRRHLPIASGLAMAGVTVGLGSLLVSPPPTVAACDVKLLPRARANPVDQQRAADEESLQFFQGAERAFAQPELVQATLRQLGSKAPDAQMQAQMATEVAEVSSRLKLEPIGDHLFHASYVERPRRAPGAPAAAALLPAHVKNYVQSDIARSLREFKARADFLRGQVTAIDRELASINDQKAGFREANADRLPEEATHTLSSRAELESRRADLTAQVRRLQGELGAARRQLHAEKPLAQTRFEASRVYRDSLAEANRKLSAAYARGLGDAHPEVQALRAERERLQQLAEAELAAQPSTLDRQSNPAYQALQSRVEGLESQLAAARDDLADTERSLARLRTVVGALPRVEQRLDQLNHAQESTSRLHAQLFEKMKEAELQLALEQVSAQSRYEIGPVRVERPRAMLTMVLRGAVGLLAGLFLAAAWILFTEGRRFVAQALAVSESRSR